MYVKELKKSIVDHLVLILAPLIFPAAGVALLWFGEPLRLWETDPMKSVLLCLFAGVFIVPIVFLQYLNWSSVLYYYEKSVMRSYGVRVTGRLTKKYVEEDNWEGDESDSDSPTEHIYWLEWEYQYVRRGKLETFTGTEDVSKRQYEIFKVGDSIPLKLLPSRPQTSTPVYPRKSKTVDPTVTESNDIEV